MKSLTDLNSKAENDLQEFGDERTGKVMWDRTQYDTVFDVVQDENEYIGLNIPLRLTEIVNYQQTQLKLEIDLSSTTGEVQFEKDFPSWATVTEVGRVYTISGFRHINDFNELYNLDQRFRLAGYFGNTDTIGIRFHYLIQSTPAERPWTLDLDITEVLNMTSPPASQLYGIQMPNDSLVSITPPIVSDPGNIGVDFRMEISASEVGVLQTIFIPQTSGATTVINSSDKTVLIEGTVAQINTELAGLQVRFGEVEVDFDLVFELTDVFEDSSAGLISDLKVTRFTSITTDLEISRQYIYDDSLLNPSLEKPFRDGRFTINATSGVTLTISVPNNAFRYLTNISPEVYSLDTTSVTLSGITPDDLETIVDNLRYIAPQTYAGDIEWDFTLTVDGTTYLNAYRYDMAGNYVVWDGVGSGVGASFTANIIEGAEVNSTDYPAFVWGSNGGTSTIDIVAINNPSEANILITWDLAYSDTVPNYGSTLDWELHWDNLPSGVSVTKTLNNKYRVVGIDSVSDWDAVKHPDRATMPNDASGDFIIKGTVTYTPDRTKEMTMRFSVNEEREFGIQADWWTTTDGEERSGNYEYSVSFLNYTRGYTGGEIPTVTVIDIGQDNPTYTVTITPDKPNSVDDIHAGGSLGGSVLFNDASKTLTIIGSKAQVNDHLANITIDMSINSMEHGYLRYAVQNNVNTETDACAVYLGGTAYDPVFSFDCTTTDTNTLNNIFNIEYFEIKTSDMEQLGTSPSAGDSLILSLYNTTHLTSVTMEREIFFDDNKGFSSSYSSANSITDVHPFRHPVHWTFNYIASNAYEYIQSHNQDNTYHYIAPYDQGAFIREFQPHGDSTYESTIRVEEKLVSDIEYFGRVDDVHRIYHQTNYYPKNYYSTTEADYVGYGVPSSQNPRYKDPSNNVTYAVAEDEYNGTTSPDGNGWIIRHEPEHFGHCITTNSDTSKIAISHAGEVYTAGIYGDRYFYGSEYSGIPGQIGATYIGEYGVEWGDFGSLRTSLERNSLGQSNYVEQFNNDYRATHAGVVYIYDDTTNYYTETNDAYTTNGATYATPIQKIYPPISDSSGDPIAPAGNHLLFGEYNAMSLDGNRLAITCPGWQSGNVDGVSLKGVYTYTFNNVTNEYDLDAVLNGTALIKPEWDDTGNILVGQDRDDITKLRIYSRNSNGSLSLLESLNLTSTYVNNWDFSPVSRTIVISNADGTIDVYEINNSTLDYSKTQEFSKGASDTRGEVQISTDGLMIVWKVNGFSNSDDSANDWAGFGQFIIFRDSVSEEFESGLNNSIAGVTVVNGVEHTNSLDIAAYINNANRAYYPYTNSTDHQSYYGAVFPLGNRWTWSAIFAPPNAGSGISNNTATIVWQPSDEVNEYGTNTTVKFNVDTSNIADYELVELRLEYTPSDSSTSVVRNKAYAHSKPFPYTDNTFIWYHDLPPAYSEGDTPAWSEGYLSGGTPGNI